jgi:hypothetical protein
MFVFYLIVSLQQNSSSLEKEQQIHIDILTKEMMHKTSLVKYERSSITLFMKNTMELNTFVLTTCLIAGVCIYLLSLIHWAPSDYKTRIISGQPFYNQWAISGLFILSFVSIIIIIMNYLY